MCLSEIFLKSVVLRVVEAGDYAQANMWSNLRRYLKGFNTKYFDYNARRPIGIFVHLI